MARHQQHSTAPLSRTAFQALAAYRYALRRFLHFSTQAAREADMSQQQYQVLLLIKAAPDDVLLTIGEIAAQMQVRHHSAVGLVDRLVRRGWLRRLADNKDGRRVRVGLTTSGEKTLGKLAAVHRNELRRLGSELVCSLQSLGAD